ncbi:hypothetical protein LFM09_35260 [Lentzea alba]|uniref:hypothetical protein n=1 Tax=Lentzea alba TaxID=2714351 RepID=UPI0039BF3730
MALRFDWTSVKALAPLSACETALSLEAFRAGTANRPIGPRALPLKFRPRRPLEMLDSRDPRSPALLCNPCIEESFMEKPVLPVGPPLPVPGGAEGDGVGFGAGFGDGDGVGLTFPLAMSGVSPVLRQNKAG